MDTKIFLQGFDNKKSSNTSSGLNVEFKGRRKLLPLNDVAEVISQYDQYTEERENCNVIRLTCQVNPICSNVLFNKITEIVKGEGSDEISLLNYGVIGDNHPFDEVIYKPSGNNAIEFWSGSSMNYLSVDSIVYAKDSKSTTITSAVEDPNSIKNYRSTSADSDIPNQVKHPTNAIRDAQLSKFDSNGESFVYHCGIDFFNNHLLRSNTFKMVCKCQMGMTIRILHLIL